MQNNVDPMMLEMYNRLVNSTMQANSSGAVTGSAIDKGISNDVAQSNAADVMQQYYRDLENLYRQDPRKYYEYQKFIKRYPWGFAGSSNGATGASA